MAQCLCSCASDGARPSGSDPASVSPVSDQPGSAPRRRQRQKQKQKASSQPATRLLADVRQASLTPPTTAAGGVALKPEKLPSEEVESEGESPRQESGTGDRGSRWSRVCSMGAVKCERLDVSGVCRRPPRWGFVREAAVAGCVRRLATECEAPVGGCLWPLLCRAGSRSALTRGTVSAVKTGVERTTLCRLFRWGLITAVPVLQN